MQRFKEALHIALSNLTTNAIRSVLSVLGIVIGIASVITVLSVGAGAKQKIMESITAMGVNVYYVRGQYEEATGRMGTLDQNDIDTLEQLPFVTTAFPQLNLYQMLRSRSAESRGFVNAVRPSYMNSEQIFLIQGRKFSPVEIEERNLVCLIDESAAAYFFPGGNAVGETLFVEKTPWTIIGIFSRSSSKSKKRANEFGGLGSMEILAPLPAVMRNIPNITIQTVEVHVRTDAGPQVDKEILKAIERNDPKRKGLFQVQDLKKYYDRTLEIQKTMSLIGAIVAGISLIVGGIGMMNVMLTSVAERTREIGIRRAVGARKKDILFQFLVESCVLSGVGGILGLLLGAATGRPLPLLFKEAFPVMPQLQPSFLLLSVGIGVILGVAFGFYPAVKASKLSPAEALRTE